MIQHASFSLKPFNTFGIDACCSRFIELTSLDDVRQWCRLQQEEKQPFFILGGGSNVVFYSRVDKSVVKISLKGIEVSEQDDVVTVAAAAGENWSDFVDFCVQKGWGGLENLTGIPGTVGAAPVQNIGAYGVEAKDVIDQVFCLEIDSGKEKVFSNEACHFGYRDSIFKQALHGKVIVTAVTFRLQKRPTLHLSYRGIVEQLQKEGITHPSVFDVSRAVRRLRDEKLPDPAVLGSAGSFFKNPIISIDAFDALRSRFPDVVAFPFGQEMKIAAGWLIEKCGWKGKRMGNVAVYDKQALVLVNVNHCIGEEVEQLAFAIQSSVKSTFQIDLIPEALFVK
ncbi:MAG: UDP-N-acetylmuramate dehydrogenase [Microbacter sp.]